MIQFKLISSTPDALKFGIAYECSHLIDTTITMFSDSTYTSSGFFESRIQRVPWRINSKAIIEFDETVLFRSETIEPHTWSSFLTIHAEEQRALSAFVTEWILENTIL